MSGTRKTARACKQVKKNTPNSIELSLGWQAKQRVQKNNVVRYPACSSTTPPCPPSVQMLTIA